MDAVSAFYSQLVDAISETGEQMKQTVSTGENGNYPQ